MKTLKMIILMVMVIGFTACGSAQTNQDEDIAIDSSSGNVEVFYFHFSRRCATCKIVEEVTKTTIDELYGNKVKYSAMNLEDAEGKLKGGELGISGQTVLIVSGDTRINITNEGFMNARTKPEIYKQLIKEKIDPLL
jgi:ABC-type glycerol-3-phosphate transport system substrate-binding protein